RDALLGLPDSDRDWVVVGATPEDMAARKFIPVGGDFPVFLHPVTKEEYALARTERKSGRGYKGFTFYTGADVTLEDDLQRRDLTVNAIARRPDGLLVDPLDGQTDIKNKVLRHVGQAFTEDPVRLLRLARFAARFHDFSVASETLELARRLVADGEVDALVPERVWQELAKGLMTEQPGRMFEVLQATGALPRIMPGMESHDGLGEELGCAARRKLPLPSRFALACRRCEAPAEIGRHLRAPAECQDYARLFPMVLAGIKSERGVAGDAGPGMADDVTGDLADDGPQRWLDLMERCDALRKPQRFMDLIAATACVVDVDEAVWRQRMEAMRSVDAGAIARTLQGKPQEIKQALREARLRSLQSL
ncbi:MAG TPA: tRNA CCA-pyrophosphorylase, partial [Burkholderiaceae bacterium]|nr:tRNA CCA-pyrophosphorylase [Burkholderiaceae bacterium]